MISVCVCIIHDVWTVRVRENRELVLDIGCSDAHMALKLAAARSKEVKEVTC